jgi:hypothetical protein
MTKRIHIFRAGRHVDVSGRPVEFTAAQLGDIASSYSASVGEAPLVIGHPKLDDPAQGWVDKLEVDGDDLYAVPAQVNPAFAAEVEAGRYKKVSPSFFLPDSPGNPTPGKMYLKHVGFLGAAVPAVPGLRPVAFAADAQAVEVEFAAGERTSWLWGTLGSLLTRLRDSIVARDGVEAAEQTMPQWEVDAIRNAAVEQRVLEHSYTEPTPVPAFAAPVDESAVPAESGDHRRAVPGPTAAASTAAVAPAQAPADFAARDAELAAREAALAEREAAIRAAERERQRDQVVSFAAALVNDGRLLPREQPMVVELLAQLDAEPASISFAAGDGATCTRAAGRALRDLLEALPVRVPMGELGRAEKVTPAVVSFAAPQGASVDPDRLELYARAQEYQRAHPGTSIVDAAIAVQRHH